jgi:hypothetical protein
MLGVIVRGLKSAFGRRENEFDTGRPGAPRTMTGLFHRLEEKKKQKVLAYKGAEYCGGGKRKLRR